MHDLENLSPWEKLLKLLVWKQLGSRKDLRILDFGSGNGITANYFAKDNDLVAVEPSEEALKNRVSSSEYSQIIGDISTLENFTDSSFDLILCHNVLEYIEDKEVVIKEFERLLKKGGQLSIVKHNVPGRVMQMVVLLDNFTQANELLDGEKGKTAQHEPILYYDADFIEDFNLSPRETYGIRTFWHLQQNQEKQTSEEWQAQMMQIEERVSQIPEYQAIAFFHHIIFDKRSES